MERHTYLFSIEGAYAEEKMQRLIVAATAIGGFSAARIPIETLERLEPSQANASRLLTLLLSTSVDYRDRWIPYCKGPSTGHIQYTAIGRVLRQHIARDAQPGDKLPTEAHLKDRAYRALTGHTLTAETLELFMSAFRFSDDDRTRLVEVFDAGSGQTGASAQS